MGIQRTVRRSLLGRLARVLGAMTLAAGGYAFLTPAVPAEAATPGQPFLGAGTEIYHLSPETNPGVLRLGVADSSQAPGARIVQWGDDNGPDQEWWLLTAYDGDNQFQGFEIQNVRSGLCIDAENPYAGEVTYQEPCTPGNLNQIFKEIGGPLGTNASGVSTVWQQQSTGYVLDIQGDSLSYGANLDLWYYNANLNQQFALE